MTGAVSPVSSLECNSSRIAGRAVAQALVPGLSPGHGLLITPRVQCFDLAASDYAEATMPEGEDQTKDQFLAAALCDDVCRFDLTVGDALPTSVTAQMHGEHLESYEDVAQSLQDAADALRSLINTNVITSCGPGRSSVAVGATQLCSDRRLKAQANVQQVARGKQHGRFIH